MIDRPTPSPWAILTTILIGTFVGTLGNSMSNVALPAIMAEFAVPLSSALWVVSLYTLLFAVLMPVAGYLGDRYGHRRMYLLGMALFTAALLGSGLAPSFPWLLGSRALLGIAVAPTLPAVMTIIARIFSPTTRGRAVGFWALVNGAGHALGPPISGFLIQHLGWRAVFLFGVPLCLINLFLVWRLVPSDDVSSTENLDWGGAATLTATILSLMLALTESTQHGWFTPHSLTLWIVCLILLVAFIIIERRVPHPFVELDLFTNRHYASATFVISAQLFCLFGLLLTLPVFLTRSEGWSDQSVGLLVLPLPLTMALAAPLAGRLADDRGSRWTCTIGMILVTMAGLGLLAFHPTADHPITWWQLMAGIIVLGAGMGLIQSPAAAVVTRVVAPQRLGVATGVFHMCRFVSGSLGSTVFGLTLQAHTDRIATGLQINLMVIVGLAMLATLGAQGLPDNL